MMIDEASNDGACGAIDSKELVRSLIVNLAELKKSLESDLKYTFDHE